MNYNIDQMIRFPNPGSDINQLINIFKLLYTNLSASRSFDLNNMADIMVNANVASSSGYIGIQALARSYEHTDSSRNPLYNQSKMYAEVYRLLGWIVSGEDAALSFNFTFLGIHVATAGDDSGKLFEQSLLGISYPNKILDVKFNDINRPFVSILQTASSLGNEICRDEILIGPMSLSNGYNQDQVEAVVERINSIRLTRKYSNLEQSLENLTKELNITKTTARNYTRFVISSLVFCGWFTKETSYIYGSKKDFLQLTPKGNRIVAWLETTVSVDARELSSYTQEISQSISKLGLLQMLKRADFLVEQELSDMQKEKDVARDKYGTEEVLFSPYQYFDSQSIQELLPEYELEVGDEKVDFSVGEANARRYVFKSSKEVELIDASKNEARHNKAASTLLNTLKESGDNVDVATKRMNDTIVSMKQVDFYPFVAELFQIILASDARAPQAGVNNERFDVIIPNSEYSIPVEVKSPTEEMMISVKAIRQAVENKVVMVSRYGTPYPTHFDISTFAVGYTIPNERSDVYRLIEDIYSTYKINVAIADTATLISAAYYCLLNEKSYQISDFMNVRGVINFANL